ncbi:MAG TPA: DcaP family trimeric outer membrane transporter [Pyrinomonadaceae bacterium]|nr:DcaP family trimeric outer membrane transporter [Pyrinomonadaceae bacterium]
MKLNLQQWARAAGATLLAIVLAAIVAPSIRAQTPDAKEQTPEVQQLKERVKQLEQTVEELKGQIGAIEDAQKQTTSAPVGENVATSAPEPAPIPTEKPAEKAQDDKKGGSTFEVYGFAMMDMGYEFKQQHPDWFDVVRPTKLPSFKDEFGPDGHTYFGVRQTRLGVRSSTPTKYGELKTQFEFELFGTGVDAGQTTFRLRHAYGELGQFGAGQTWSPFMDIDVFPNSIEYWGPTGMVFFRNVQARWMPIKGRSRVTIALERPGASGDQGVYADRIELQGIKPKFAWPDLSWEARYGRDWGYVELAGIFRSIRWVDTNDDQFDLGGSDFGWGLNLSSNINFTKNDIGRFQVVYGEGIQNYMNDAPVDIGIRNNFGDPRRPIKGTALPVLGVVAFLDHSWNKRFSSSVGYSLENITNSDAQSPSAFRRGHYALGNLLFYPADKVMVGGEFQWGRRENFRDGFTSDDFRIQISMKYNFSKLWEF